MCQCVWESARNLIYMNIKETDYIRRTECTVHYIDNLVFVRHQQKLKFLFLIWSYVVYCWKRLQVEKKRNLCWKVASFARTAEE